MFNILRIVGISAIVLISSIATATENSKEDDFYIPDFTNYTLPEITSYIRTVRIDLESIMQAANDVQQAMHDLQEATEEEGITPNEFDHLSRNKS